MESHSFKKFWVEKLNLELELIDMVLLIAGGFVVGKWFLLIIVELFLKISQ